MEIKAVIFDFDGTLYDFKGLPKNLVFSSFHNILKINAVQKTRRKLKGIDFSSSEKYKKEFFKYLTELGRFKNEDNAINWYKNVYMVKMILVLTKKYHKRPDVEKVINILKSKNIKVAIYSDYGMLKERLCAIGLNNDFISSIDGFFSSEDFGCLKPAKRGFLEVAKKLNVSPENCLMIGDRKDTDGDGAFSANMQFVEIKTHKTKKGYKPQHQLVAFEDLYNLFN